MNKKVWTQPQAIAEQFVANEYVAACWGIECLVPDTMLGRDGFGKDAGGHNDYKGTCGHIESQYVRDRGGDKYELTEKSGNYNAWLPCTVYPEGFNYTTHTLNGSGKGSLTFTITPEDIAANPDGVTLYWTTEYGNAKYYHYGVVDVSDKSVRHS